MIRRIFNIPESLSFFLFGARATGKSTLLKSLFANQMTFWIDLLNLEVEGKYQLHPEALEEELGEQEKNPNIKWVVIDEIQRVPKLLDLVHRQIEKKRFRFALTGSSARKLKRGAANLLAGRAIQNYLFPLTNIELGSSFDLDFVLRWGSLPQVFSISDVERMDYLRTYVNTYLREEIQVEQIVRKLQPFRAFLEVAAQCAGKIVNYSKIARDIGSDPVSVKSYFEILEDTLVGFHLPPFHRSIRKRQRKSPKFYFFDLGVTSALCRTLHLPLQQQTYAYGNAFEQWIIQEAWRLNHYYKCDWSLSYLRTKDDAEIDLIMERPGDALKLIEIKSSARIRPEDIQSLERIGRDIPNAQMYCLSKDSNAKQINNVTCYPWQHGLNRFFCDKATLPQFVEISP